MSSLTEPRQFAPLDALRQHWREFLIEAWALGVFMIAASAASTALRTLPPQRQNLWIGITMGCTAIALIYSPWGKRSGAHMNPSVTLAFLSLGRISLVNATWYILFQFVGGWLGVMIAWLFLGSAFAQTPVRFIVTQPGAAGAGVAFGVEMAMSFTLMLTILLLSNEKRWARYTGFAAGLLIALFVGFESPLSGMSLNPARTLASALPARDWNQLWVYFTAPIAGMWLAARVFHALVPWVERSHHTAKIVPSGV
jgi:aquaporin Z